MNFQGPTLILERTSLCKSSRAGKSIKEKTGPSDNRVFSAHAVKDDLLLGDVGN